MRYLGQLDPVVLAQMKAAAGELSEEQARDLYEISSETDFGKKKFILHVAGGAGVGLLLGTLFGALLWKKK